MQAEDAGEFVQRLLQARGIYSFPIDIERIARSLGATIYRAFRLSRDVPGFLYPGPACPVIVLNGNDPKTRQRFTIGHELWHLLFDDDRGVRLFDPESWADHAPWREQSAHQFAQELLMPTELFLAAWHEHGDFNRLCRQTNASKQAVNRRMRDLGLIER